jgi:hypothetical protein
MIGLEKNDNLEMMMMSVELQAHFTQLVGNHVQDMNTRFVDTMERIDGLETSFTQQLDTKFQEMMAHLPPPTAASP